MPPVRRPLSAQPSPAMGMPMQPRMAMPGGGGTGNPMAGHPGPAQGMAGLELPPQPPPAGMNLGGGPMNPARIGEMLTPNQPPPMTPARPMLPWGEQGGGPVTRGTEVGPGQGPQRNAMYGAQGYGQDAAGAGAGAGGGDLGLTDANDPLNAALGGAKGGLSPMSMIRMLKAMGRI